MNSLSKKEKDKLEIELLRLKKAYPQEIYSKLKEEPEDILAYCRAVVAFQRRPDVKFHDVQSIYWK